jgi:hypothetical protein
VERSTHVLALALVVVVALVVATGYTKAAKPYAAQAPASCITAIKLMTSAVSTLNQASQTYASLILPAYKAGFKQGSATAIVAAENRATAKVNRAGALVRKATPYSVACKRS